MNGASPRRIGRSAYFVQELGVERDRVLDGRWPVEPQRWAIGGVDAVTLRADEVRARASAAAT
jgi:hypothetical protein